MRDFIDEIMELELPRTHQNSCNCSKCRQKAAADQEEYFLDDIWAWFKPNPQPAPLLSQSKLQKAVRYNHRKARSVGWSSYVQRIARLIGLRSGYSQEDFAQAVAKWQQSKGLTMDGMLGPVTWRRMRTSLSIGSPSSPTSPTTPSLRGRPSYARMARSYPTGSVSQVKRLIGGRVNANWITNTCVVRVSRSLNYAGHPIPKRFRGLLTVSGGDGKQYALRVREFKKYLTKTYGPADVVYNNPSLSSRIPSSFRGKKGIIVFDVDVWSDATGHATLWNGSDCVNGDCKWNKAHKVSMWFVNP